MYQCDSALSMTLEGGVGVSETVQWGKALAATPEDLGAISGIYMASSSYPLPTSCRFGCEVLLSSIADVVSYSESPLTAGL